MMRKTRRSENKSDPVLTAKYYCKQKGDQGGFKKIYINENIGDGVFAIKDFKCGEFLLEYAGNLVSKVEGEKLQKKYSEDVGSFLFFYNDYCIDATHNTQFGKYVNDSKVGRNCCIKPVYDNDGLLHLCLFALCDRVIKAGEELRYSYGDMKELFWRKNKETTLPYFLNYNKITKQFVVADTNSIKVLKELNCSFSKPHVGTKDMERKSSGKLSFKTKILLESRYICRR